MNRRKRNRLIAWALCFVAIVLVIVFYPAMSAQGLSLSALALLIPGGMSFFYTRSLTGWLDEKRSKNLDERIRTPHSDPDAVPKFEQPVLSDWE